jgi:serine/threonine protein kinase
VRSLFDKPSRLKSSTSIPRRLRHYKLLKEIGAGANGFVYKALDHRRNQDVAIKMLRPAADEQSRQRFRREAEIAMSLNHPNIVAVHDFLHDKEMDYIVMEYVAGTTLAGAIPREGLSPEIFLDYALQMADAVSAMHSAELIHRDLKLGNFMVQKDRNVKLLDFGLAKDIGGKTLCASRKRQLPETLPGAIVGTAGYMAPEQVLGHTADPRADVFSLGAIFYEMLTKRRAFQGESRFEIMTAIVRQSTPMLPAHIPGAIANIIRRCLQKERNHRYDSATELLAELTAIRRSKSIPKSNRPMSGKDQH